MRVCAPPISVAAFRFHGVLYEHVGYLVWGFAQGAIARLTVDAIGARGVLSTDIRRLVGVSLFCGCIRCRCRSRTSLRGRFHENSLIMESEFVHMARSPPCPFHILREPLC